MFILALSVDGYMYVVSGIQLSSEYSTEFRWIYKQSMGGCCWAIQTPKIVDPHYIINVSPLATITDVYNCFQDQSSLQAISLQAICSDDAYTTGNFGFQSECQYNHIDGYFNFTNCLGENNYTFHQDCNSNPTSMEGNYSTVISSTETTSMPMLSTDDNMPAPHQSATVTSSEETSITDDFQITATAVELLSSESTSSTVVTISSTALPDEITIEETISTVFHRSTSTVDESIMSMSITPSHSTTTLVTSTFANSVSSSSTIIVSSPTAPEQEEGYNISTYCSLNILILIM